MLTGYEIIVIIVGNNISIEIRKNYIDYYLNYKRFSIYAEASMKLSMKLVVILMDTFS